MSTSKIKVPYHFNTDSDLNYRFEYKITHENMDGEINGWDYNIYSPTVKFFKTNRYSKINRKSIYLNLYYMKKGQDT